MWLAKQIVPFFFIIFMAQKQHQSIIITVNLFLSISFCLLKKKNKRKSFQKKNQIKFVAKTNFLILKGKAKKKLINILLYCVSCRFA